MRAVRTFNDERLDKMCTYCGDKHGTRDHVPSKILLNEPFPENLPIVYCCDNCNQSFSLDEQYFACSLECIIHGTTDIDKLNRKKIKETLLKNKKLQQRIENSFIYGDNIKVFKYEEDRFKNVITKLAKGHIKFETSEPKFDNPSHIGITTIGSMSEQEINSFFKTKELEIAPEVGSRGTMILNFYDDVPYATWEDVQSEVYQYCIIQNKKSTHVKIFIQNYFVIQVVWE
ncbi:hypothetical protein [Flavobacterium sp. Root186]|uniref:hypothetical protein n=1 Tax=Flavobacterium sp. Root186 TaxID=1736485 RepID=UPI0006FA290D|nr:hypothetical protein [Flavobacterium sp. Root186]KRB55907.1 hypothetical protein ASD98_14775 [Flavobacterium sp. Root186]